MNPDFAAVCNRLLGALLNGGYQGLLLVVALWFALRVLRRTNAATRHAFALVTLLLVAALPIVHFVLPARGGTALVSVANEIETPREGERSVSATSSASTVVAGTHSASTSGILTFDVPAPLDFGLQSEASDSEAAFAAPGGLTRNAATLHSRSGIAPDVSDSIVPRATPALPMDRVDNGAVAAPSPSIPVPRLRLAIPNWISVGFIALWAALVSVRLGGLVRQCCELRTLKLGSGCAPDSLAEEFEALRREAGVTRQTQLLIGPDTLAPMALGFRKPAILIPARHLRECGPAELQQILRHELAHVQRHDDWATLVQEVVRAALFFHPAVWWLTRRLRVEREIACDDHVLAATRLPRSYALLLTDFASRTKCRTWTAAPAAWSSSSQLKERIDMILDTTRNSSPRLARGSVSMAATIAALVAIIGMNFAPRVAFAQATPPADATTGTSIAETERAVSPKTVAASPADSTTESADLSQPPAPVPAVPPAATLASPPRPKATLAPPAPDAPVARVLGNIPGPPAVASVSAPAVASVSALAPIPPRPVEIALESSGDAPRKPVASSGARRSKDSDDSSVEQRLERLERMVESMMARETGSRGKTEWNPLPQAGINVRVPMAGLSKEESARIKEHVEREMQRAERQVERATREAQRAMDAARSADVHGRQAHASSQRHELEMQRKALESELKALEKQVQAIEKQIDKLDDHQEKIEEQAEKIERKQEKTGEKSVDEKGKPRKQVDRTPESSPKPEPRQ